ncbi:MAG: hypothetical protein JO333_12465 [Verrucomicrobia bacterium]|nr:hypothetical protein [Verrucomicrobiota bacterium]
MGSDARARESRARTRAFARLIGPWLTIVPTIIVLRAPGMGYLASEFFKSELFMWFTGAMLLFWGLLIIAFHQYWSSLAAVIISIFGWFLAVRGLVLLAAPDFYDRAAMIIADQRGFFRGGPSISIVLIYGALVVIGIYLTYVGWLAKPASSK